MNRTLVRFSVAVALGVPGNPQAQIRQRGPRLAAEPVVPLDRKTFAIEFEPQDAPAGLAQQFVIMKSRSTSTASYDVGYRKPPKANRFPKGRTGNPRGKRRGEENIISAFKRIVSERVKIKDGDQICTIRLYEAVILKNLNAALQKNAFAMGNIYRLAEECGEFVDRTDPKQVGRPFAVPIRSKNITEFLARFGRSPETE